MYDRILPILRAELFRVTRSAPSRDTPWPQRRLTQLERESIAIGIQRFRRLFIAQNKEEISLRWLLQTLLDWDHEAGYYINSYFPGPRMQDSIVIVVLTRTLLQATREIEPLSLEVTELRLEQHCKHNYHSLVKLVLREQHLLTHL